MELSSVNPNVPMPAHVSSLFAFDWKLVVTVTRIRTNHLCWDRYRKGTDLLQCRFTYSIMLEDSKTHLSDCGQNEDTCSNNCSFQCRQILSPTKLQSFFIMLVSSSAHANVQSLSPSVWRNITIPEDHEVFKCLWNAVVVCRHVRTCKNWS